MTNYTLSHPIRLLDEIGSPRSWEWEQPSIPQLMVDGMERFIDKFIINLKSGSFSYNKRKKSHNKIDLATFLALEIKYIKIYTVKRGLFSLSSTVDKLIPKIKYRIRELGLDTRTEIKVEGKKISVIGELKTRDQEMIDINRRFGITNND